MACADVTSANVVGYNNVPLLDGGTKMIGPCFITVGDADHTLKLSDLTIKGYENSEYYLCVELAFGATFQIRQSNGMPEVTYQYSDLTDDCVTWNGGKWFNLDTGAEITKDNDVTFNAGDAFWFSAPDLQDCSGFYLASSGEVIKGSQAVELKAGGTVGVCNLMPTATTLSQIEIQGYENSEYYLCVELMFGMTMQSLKSNGMPQVTYQYSDSTDDCATWNGGQWFNLDTGAEITTDNDVTIAAGEGFWASAPDLQDCDAFTFVVPACLAK